MNSLQKKTENNNEIETEIENIKSNKKKVIKTHELSDLKNKRSELYHLWKSGQGYDGLLKEYIDLQKRIRELEQGKLQNLKEGGIVSLARGGFLNV